MQPDILAYRIFCALVEKAKKYGEFEHWFAEDAVLIMIRPNAKAFRLNEQRSSAKKVSAVILAYVKKYPMTAEAILEALE